MERLYAFFFLGALFGIALISETAAAESIISTSDVGPSVARILKTLPLFDTDSRHLALDTSVRTMGSIDVKGGVDGQMDSSFGNIKYRGKFGGDYSPRRANLHLHMVMNGTQNLDGSHLKYTRTSNGKIVFRRFNHSFTFNIEADDTMKLKGVSNGKSISGDTSSKIRVFVFNGKRPSFMVNGQGKFRLFVDQKLLEGTYYVSGTKAKLGYEVRGTYEGKPFFVNEKSKLTKQMEALKSVGIGNRKLPEKLGSIRNHGEGWVSLNGMRIARKFDQTIPLDMAKQQQADYKGLGW